jgi:Domain of unknown function (DUF1816)
MLLNTVSTVSQKYKPDFTEDRKAGWWIEIVVTQPTSMYYFGPFKSHIMAEKEWAVIAEDLVNEGAQGLAKTIQLYNPRQLWGIEHLDPVYVLSES